MRSCAIVLLILFLYIDFVTMSCAVPVYRYRAPLEPLMLIACSCGLLLAWQRIADGRAKRYRPRHFLVETSPPSKSTQPNR